MINRVLDSSNKHGQGNKNRKNLTLIVSILNSLPVDKKDIRKTWSMNSNHVELAPALTSFYSNFQHYGKKKKKKKRKLSTTAQMNACYLLLRILSVPVADFKLDPCIFTINLSPARKSNPFLHHLPTSINKLPEQEKGIITKHGSSKK